jgi:hypothetical protein
MRFAINDGFFIRNRSGITLCVDANYQYPLPLSVKIQGLALQGRAGEFRLSGTVIASTVQSSHADCAAWASGTNLPLRPHPGRMALVEQLIGSIRRECVDHFIVLGEAHLRRVLKSYAHYYNETRTHLALHKDAPVSRPVQRSGMVRSRAILGGLHHHFDRA